jgi:hypothetical protein
MMKRSVIFAAMALLAGTGIAAADDIGEFRLGPRGGPGQIRIQPGTPIGERTTDELVSERSFGLGATLEYHAPFGLVVEAGLFGTGTTDWFDDTDYSFSEYFGSVGYEIPLGHGFTVTPRVGRTRWTLEADDNWFFDRDDDHNPTTRGYENYWEVSAMKRISERFSLGVSYKENDFDFGRIRSTVFTAMWTL